MSSQLELVDATGDIIIHGRQGVELILELRDVDDNPRDMTGKTVTFEVGPTINKTLAAVAGHTDQLKLTLTNADVKLIYAADNKSFVFMETSASQPTPLWVGLMYVVGWIE